MPIALSSRIRGKDPASATTPPLTQAKVDMTTTQRRQASSPATSSYQTLYNGQRDKVHGIVLRLMFGEHASCPAGEVGLHGNNSAEVRATRKYCRCFHQPPSQPMQATHLSTLVCVCARYLRRVRSMSSSESWQRRHESALAGYTLFRKCKGFPISTRDRMLFRH